MSNARLKLDEILLTLTQPGGPYEIEERDLAGIRHKLYRNAPATLLDIYESSAQAADYDFIHYEQDSWSRQRLLDGAAAVSAFLRDNIGIEKGDRVAIAMRNCPEWMVAFIAITDLGAIAVPLNSWCKQQELDYMLRDSGAKFAFCDEPRYQHLQAIAADYPLQLAVVGASDRPVDAYRFEELCQAAHQPFSRALSLVGPEDPAMILYTSGTTGFPKGACSSHRAVTQSLYNLEVMGAAMTLMNQELNTDKPASSKQPPEIPRHTVLLALPLFHVSGLHTGFLNSLRSQIRIVIMPKWDAGKALKLIEKYQVTLLGGAPVMLEELLRHPEFAQHNTDSLMSVGVAGSATPERLVDSIADQLAFAAPAAGWGMTETNATGCSFVGVALQQKKTAAGFVHPIVELSVRDENAQELPPGVSGELHLKTPTLMSGYWGRNEAVPEFFPSGDLGHIDEGGCVHVTGRSKDVIIRGGENIFPVEIEHALEKVPGVAEAAVIGVADQAFGEVPVAVVRLNDRADISAELLQQLLSDSFAHYKVPQSIHFTNSPLPRNATGKILKHVLSQNYGANNAAMAQATSANCRGIEACSCQLPERLSLPKWPSLNTIIIKFWSEV